MNRSVSSQSSRPGAFTVGLVLAGLLSIVDLILAVAGDGEYPPRAITLTGAALAVATFVGIAFAVRGRRVGVWTVIVARGLSAVGAIPAFVIGDVPPAAVAAAAAVVVITVVTLVLLVPALRNPDRRATLVTRYPK